MEQWWKNDGKMMEKRWNHGGSHKLSHVGQDLLVLRTWAIAWCRMPCNKSWWCEAEEIWRWQDRVDRDRGPAKDGCSLAANSAFLSYEETYVFQQGQFGKLICIYWAISFFCLSKNVAVGINNPSSSWPSGWHSEGEGMTQLDALSLFYFFVWCLAWLLLAGEIARSHLWGCRWQQGTVLLSWIL